MKIQNGIKPLKPDHRNYSAKRTFGATQVFVDELNLDAGFGFPDQNADGYPNGCTGYTQSELCQDEDKVKYRPDFTYKKTLLMDDQQLGEPCDIKTSLKSTKVYGVQGQNETEQEAFKHIRGAYYQVEKTNDWFDGIRSSITLNNCSVSVASQWFESFETSIGQDGILPEIFSPSFSWHNYKCVGWKQINGQPYIILKSWQGKGYGDKGYCYMSRSLCNSLLSVDGAGAFIVAPYDPSKVQTVRLDIISVLLSLYYRLLEAFIKKPVVEVDHYEEVKEAIKTPEPKYKWDTKENIRHSVRVICDEEGLTLNQKNTMCATIQAESGFNLKAKNLNKNKQGVVTSTDWGLCQWNDRYHGKEITADEALNNPEKAVRLMCSYWKRGQMDLWVAHANGSYTKYL